ncbi:MAG: hypothetical protein ACTSWX_14235 [Promethearchaeota archaeon]
MTPSPDDKQLKRKKDEISEFQEELLKNSKILEDNFNSINIKSETEKTGKRVGLQDNWGSFVDNTQNIISKWESDLRELNQKIIKKRKEKKRRLILGERINNNLIDTFFSNQKKEFNKKLKELESEISNEKPLTPREIRQYRRLKRWKKRQDIKDQRREMLERLRLEKLELSEELQDENIGLKERRKKLQGDYFKEQRELRKNIAQKKRKQRAIIKQKRLQTFKEITAEKQQIRKDNWNKFIRLQQRKTQRFIKFQNRLWWKGYLNFLLEVILIVGLLLFVLWIFQLIGVNLIGMAQNLFSSG